MKELIQPNLGLVVWTSLSFLILMFVLRKYAWKPILEAVEERDQKIAQALKEAENARKEVGSLSSERDKLLADIKDERDQILADAAKTRDFIVSEAKHKATEEASRILETAREAIHNERMAAVTEVRNMAAKLAIDVAEKVLGNHFADQAKQEEFVRAEMDKIKLN
jgi:F-type H+-transporting ATPase subunit b